MIRDTLGGPVAMLNPLIRARFPAVSKIDVSPFTSYDLGFLPPFQKGPELFEKTWPDVALGHSFL